MDRKQEFLAIVRICERAEALGIVMPSQVPGNERMNLVLDLENAHKDVGLALDKLLEADDLNFSHDIMGIQQHMNRSTGKLEDFFMPRYAKQYHDVNAVVENAVKRAAEDGREQSSNKEFEPEL